MDKPVAAPFAPLLSSLTCSLERVAHALEPERPDLAHALRQRARTLRPLQPVLYEALAADLVDGREVDRLLLRATRLQRASRA
jgi:hypothetical protein